MKRFEIVSSILTFSFSILTIYFYFNKNMLLFKISYILFWLCFASFLITRQVVIKIITIQVTLMIYIGLLISGIGMIMAINSSTQNFGESVMIIGFIVFIIYSLIAFFQNIN